MNVILRNTTKKIKERVTFPVWGNLHSTFTAVTENVYIVQNLTLVQQSIEELWEEVKICLNQFAIRQ